MDWDALFSEKNITYGENAEALCTNFDLTPSQLVQLCAIPCGSDVQVAWVKEWTEEAIPDGELVPAGLHVVVKNADFLATQNEFMIYTDPTEKGKSVYLKLIDLRTFPASAPETRLNGMGGQIVKRMADAARAAHFVRLRLLAAGGRTWPDRVSGTRWGGYAAWPKYGFNAEIEGTDLTLFKEFQYHPKGLPSCRTVLEIMGLDGGPDFWKMCGSGHYMEFDLRAGSPSAKRLDAWLNPAVEGKGTKMRKKFVSTAQVTLDQPAKFAGAVSARTSVGQVSEGRMLPSSNTSEAKASIEKVKRHRHSGGAEIPAEIVD